MTRQTTALKLQVNIRTVDKLIKSGKLKVFKIGNLVRISEDALIDYLWGGKKEHE